MYKVETSTATEPITLAEAKEHLKIDSDQETDDDLIGRQLTAARQFVEKRTGICCLPTNLALYQDKWPDSGVLFLERKPITSVSKVEYFESDDASEYSTMDASDYQADIISEPGRVKIDDAPSLGDKLNAVKVTFVAGYAEASKVPENIKSAILILLGHLYENRQEEVSGTILSKLDKGFEYLLSTDELITA